jgi:hypothetical protein
LNGFPLVFSDSGTYLLYSVKEGIPLDRPVFYSWMITMFSLNTKLPLFSIIVSQALIASTVILITLSCLQITKFKLKLFMGILLSVSTSIPWFTGQLMPDFFLGIGLLSAYTLIYHYNSLNNLKRIFLLAIFISTSLVHYSNIPIILSTLSLFLILIIIYKTDDKTLHKSIITRSAILIILALMILIANHLYIKTYSQQLPTAHFLVNRLTDDGIIQKLLDEHCTSNKYILCPYKDNVKPSYLWNGKKSPFELIGGLKSPVEESWRMIYDSLIYYPLDHFLSALRTTIKQIFSFNTGDGLKVYNIKSSINRIIKGLYNYEYIDFTNSKQQQGKLEKLLSITKPVHNIVVGISFLALLLSLIRRKNHADATFFLTIFILSAIICNAAVCGIFSGVYDRYQSRIIWLVPFTAIVILLRWYDSRENTRDAKISINQATI